MKQRKHGFTSVGFVLFVFIFLIITSLSIEFYYIHTLKEHIDTEMSRACNIATDMAMIDEYRQMHISKMSVDVANTEFDEYLHSVLKLDSQNRKVKNGKTQYTLVFESRISTETPASYEVSGYILTQPILLSKLVPIDIQIPFHEKSRNQRFE